MANRVFVVSNDLCSGCRNCQMWCSFLQTRGSEFRPTASSIRIVTDPAGDLNEPEINCKAEECLSLASGSDVPTCVRVCPTGCLIYTDEADVQQKRVQLHEARQLQPLFKLIAPWKYPYPWRPLAKEEM